jgi:MATE family multidrug resistance protein
MSGVGAVEVVVPVEATISGEARRLAGLAWPVVLGQVGLMSMGLVDVLVAGRAGEHVLAVVGAGRTWSFSLTLLGLGALHGLDPLFAQAWGAGDHARGEQTLGRGVLLTLLISAPIVGGHLLAGPGLALLAQPAELIPGAHDYSVIRAIGVPFVLLYSLLTRYHQGQGRMRLPMLCVVVGNLVNLALDLSLVQGLTWGPLTVPALGADGVAMATTTVELSMMVVMAALSGPALRGAWAARSTLLRPAELRLLLALCLPVAAQVALEAWAFNVAGLMVGTTGATALAAHTIALTLASFTFMVPLGIGGAASTRVGNLLGAGHRWQRAGWLAVGMAALWMLGCGLGLYAFTTPILGLFSSDAAVLAVGATILPIAAAFQLFDGVQASTFGVLRGAGDTRWPSLANLLGYWVLGLPLGWVLSTRGELGAVGVWLGLALGLAVVAVLLLIRLGSVARSGGTRVVPGPP